MVSLQSVMVAKHFNCVHITPDNLVVESDSKAAKKVQVVIISLKYCTTVLIILSHTVGSSVDKVLV